MRTREGMKVAKANGRLRGKQPKLKPNQAKHLLDLHDLGTYTQAELAELFGVGRSTICRTLSGCGLRRRNPNNPSHTLRIRRRRAEPDMIPIKQSKGSAQRGRGGLARPAFR
jgi:DNA invertase Pin-like site-specific DNA recombinase